MDNELKKRIGMVLAELKAQMSAMISADDVRDFFYLISEGFTTPRLKEIVADDRILKDIQTSKLAYVEFDQETMDVLTSYLANNGVRGDIIAAAYFDKSITSNVLKFWCRGDKISMVFVMDGNIVCVVEDGREQPIYLQCKDSATALALHDELTNATSK